MGSTILEVKDGEGRSNPLPTAKKSGFMTVFEIKKNILVVVAPQQNTHQWMQEIIKFILIPNTTQGNNRQPHTDKL